MATTPKSKTTTRTRKRSVKSYLTPSTKRAKTQASQESLAERIQRKAYELYQLRGCADGFDQFDWSVAESFIKLENQLKSSRAKAAQLADGKDIEGDIQKKAYELFERRGYTHGNNELDWRLARDLVYLQKQLPQS